MNTVPSAIWDTSYLQIFKELFVADFGVFQGFNGADLRNVCTEAGMFAIRADRDYVVQEDFMKVRLLFLRLGVLNEM